MEITKRYFTDLKDSFFIFGPRGTGKSTWIKNALQDAYIINLLDDQTYLNHLKDPTYIKSIVAGNPKVKIYVIDEIQKAPKILDSIHELIESNKDIRFILTGSSARKLRHSASNLLASRALLTYMHPFMASELGKNFKLDYALQYGLIPLIVASKNPQRKLASYIRLYLKEEIGAEGLVREIGSFSRFLEIISFSHGCVLNINNIARECQISRRIVENYVSILADLLLSYEVPVFTKRAKRETIAHSKFYLFDSGVYYHLRPKGPLDHTDEIGGIALEGLVLQNLRAWIDYSTDSSLQCYFWRTRSGVEVDFIIYGDNYFKAIEVKHTNKLHPIDIKPLKEFCLDYPEASPLVLYRGKDKIMLDGILCWPVEDFLRKLVPNDWPE